MKLKIIILAAGKGTRMCSSISKGLHGLAGIPILEHVIRTASSLSDDLLVVYGTHTAIPEQFKHFSARWVKQTKQLGTGHAVLQALPLCHDDDLVLVLCADVPLISRETLSYLIESRPANGLSLLIANTPNPKGLGRIIRDKAGNITQIIEHREATPAQLAINEIYAGILVAPASYLKQVLPTLNTSNQKHECYLTDIVQWFIDHHHPVYSITVRCPEEVQGVNTRSELAQLERYYQQQMAHQLMKGGVTLYDPARFDIRGDDVQTGQDVIIDVNVILEGHIRIGNHVYIGPNVILKNTTIADHVRIEANSVIEGAQIASHCQIGPFARVRPETVIASHAKIGNFVETKKTTIGSRTKANHLTYLGDAMIGEDVNIGAGTIICNYDGVNKWSTHIQNGAFIGSNVSLVAPVTIAVSSTIGAGSTITENTEPNQLTVARAKQINVSTWTAPKKKKQKKES